MTYVIRNEKEYKEMLAAMEEFKKNPPAPEVNKFYKWGNGQNPSRQGGRLQCVYTTKDQSVYQNQHGLHIIANAHFRSGDLIVSA